MENNSLSWLFYEFLYSLDLLICNNIRLFHLYTLLSFISGWDFTLHKFSIILLFNLFFSVLYNITSRFIHVRKKKNILHSTYFFLFRMSRRKWEAEYIFTFYMFIPNRKAWIPILCIAQNGKSSFELIFHFARELHAKNYIIRIFL